MSDTPTQTIADALLLLSLGNDNEIGKDASERLMKLERENAALRADKERLDLLEALNWEPHLWVKIAYSKNLRAAIDAARKEAKP